MSKNSNEKESSAKNLDIFSKNNFINLNQSSSLNAESQMVPVINEKQPKAAPHKKPTDYIPSSLNGTNELGGTNGSTNRRLNKELDEIEKMNLLNQQEFPGSLQGTGNIEDVQIPPITKEIAHEDNESLRNTSQFENFPPDVNENENPNKSLENSATYKLNNTSLSDPTMKNGSMKIDKFDGFPEIPEYEGIQKDYIATMKSRESNPEDPLEGTAGTAKSIDFDELQQKLVEKTDVSPYKQREEASQQERKKWGHPQAIQSNTKESKLDSINKEMEGIDDLLQQFSPKEDGTDIPVYESTPDNFNKYEDEKENLYSEKYKPNMDSILEQSNEYTKSGDNDLLSKSERKLIMEQQQNEKRTDN